MRLFHFRLCWIIIASIKKKSKKNPIYRKFDFHSLRHTHATELCEAGVNIKEIQRRLGHSTMEVTSKRYLHATELMEDQSVELMNAMHGGSDQLTGDDRWRGLRVAK